jgi:hypothetical protein
MSVSRNRPRKQSDSAPQATQPHSNGDDPQRAASGTPPSAGGTSGHTRPVPCTFSLLIENLDPRALTTLLTLLDGPRPANDGALAPPWTPEASALLDWLTLVEDDAGTLIAHLRQLRRAVEEIAL